MIFFSFFMFTADLRPDDADYAQVVIHHMQALKDMGYDGFDLHIAPQLTLADCQAAVDSYARLKEKFDKAGLGDMAFSTNVGTTPNFDPTSPWQQQRDAALAYLKTRIDITAALGEPAIMSGPFLYPYGAFPVTDLGTPLWSDALLDWMEPRFATAREPFVELSAYAADKGVTLAIEPVKSWETPPPNMVSQALDFIESIDFSTVPGANCGVTVDTAQVVMESQGPQVFRDNIERATRHERLHYVHVSAPDRGAVHDSWIPWELMLDTIVPVFKGPWLVEVFNAVTPFDSSMRMGRQRFWRPGEDAPKEGVPSAYDIARAGLDTLRGQLAAAHQRQSALHNHHA
ncbi:sugar phosphate isomerase/epimerase family protein [Novosphingobium sp. Rr 2-17]|uniref:sugar phosphate isomerase/epimerase family protein n=1 Tax=Novosphingobium sp. Rr 2-17 TaxID=555793 RepID=UPI0002E9B00C|nr:sugar phosphate isomerase/epimerase family protein [Novosphingobium sp. Rr 2-17]